MGLVQYQIGSYFHVCWNITVFLVQPWLFIPNKALLPASCPIKPSHIFRLSLVLIVETRSNSVTPVAKPSPSSYTLNRYPKYSAKPPNLYVLSSLTNPPGCLTTSLTGNLRE